MISRIKNDLKKAMKNGDKEKLNPLRNLIAKVKIKEIEKGESLNDTECEKIFISAAKKIKESISQFESGGRTDLVEIEKNELKVIQNYLPKELSESEILVIVRKIMKETNSSKKSDMGKVMGQVMKCVDGKADGKVVQKIVLSELI